MSAKIRVNIIPTNSKGQNLYKLRTTKSQAVKIYFFGPISNVKNKISPASDEWTEGLSPPAVVQKAERLKENG